MEMSITRIHINERTQWKRSSIIKIQTLKISDSQCELDIYHNMFTSKSTGRPYMKGHHIIPMSKQRESDKSLDVYANIVCVCPVCHRLLHYGVESQKSALLRQNYHVRARRLTASGINISKEDFIKLTI